MIISWDPVIFVDIFGSIFTLGIAIWCAVLSREWTQKKPDDIFRHYIFLLTFAIVFFAISRSFGHLVKQIFLLKEMRSSWALPGEEPRSTLCRVAVPTTSTPIRLRPSA